MPYLTEFNKAFTRSRSAVDYRISADDPTDDVAQAIGNRIVINASGPNARVNVAAGKTLEMIGANGGAICTQRWIIAKNSIAMEPKAGVIPAG